LFPYTIAPDDVSGPFMQITKRMDEQATLKCTCYSSPEEAVGEHFHISSDLLKALNPGKNLGNSLWR
jgi:hypothetical protein